MATKLRNLRMTSVDLVRNGANQKADICLFKSADPTEDPTTPTTEEKNIFKRFLDWFRENPTDELEEPADPIEKADEEPCLVEIYKSAITESLQSIAADDSLSETEKNDMIAKSLDEYHEAMLSLFGFDFEEESLQKAAEEDGEIDWGEDEEVEKANPNHDALGRFASGGGAAGGAKNPRDMKYMLRPKNGKGANWYTDEKVAGKKYVKAYAADGFETLVDLSNHDVIVNKSADIDEIEEV